MKTLEETLHEITPAPDPEFAREMEERMQLGFPPERKPWFSLPKISARPAMAVAAVAVIALVTVVSLRDGAVEDGGGGGAAVNDVLSASEPEPQALEESDAGHRRAAPQMGPDEPSAALRVQPVPRPPRDQVAPNRSDREVERSADINLAADPAEFDSIADSIFAIVARRNGFVLRSGFTQGEDGLSGGSFDLRVPVDELQATLTALSGLGTVRSRTESATDVTGRFVSLRDRLQIARADRTGLLRRLENADTERAARAIRRRLEIVAGRINGLRSQLRAMRERTNYAAVSVELVDEAVGTSSGKSDAGEAVDDAVGSLESIGLFLVRALGILLPLALVALVGWFAASRVRRRTRERALA